MAHPAFGLVRDHPYRDGNKRIGFLAMAIFLGLNGRDVSASDTEVITVIVSLAAGQVGEDELAQIVRRWIA